MSERAGDMLTGRATKEGVLGGNRILKPHGRGRTSITSLILDIVAPEFYPPEFWVACGEERAPNQHEFVYAIKGKAKDSLTLDDVGRPVRVTGLLSSRNGRYGKFTRATVEFLDG